MLRVVLNQSMDNRQTFSFHFFFFCASYCHMVGFYFFRFCAELSHLSLQYIQILSSFFSVVTWLCHHIFFPICPSLYTSTCYLCSSSSVTFIHWLPSFLGFFTYVNSQRKVQVCFVGLKQGRFLELMCSKCKMVCMYMSRFVHALHGCPPLLLVWSWDILVWIYENLIVWCWIFILPSAERGLGTKTKTGRLGVILQFYISACTKYTI